MHARGFAEELLPLLTVYGSDGVAVTHELTVVERDAGVLAGDDGLALWTMLADDLGGLPLAMGGQVRAVAVPDVPVRLPADRPAGRGLIGQALVGPPGWLAGFQPGDLLEVRLRDGTLSVSVHPPGGLRSDYVATVVSACQAAARQAVDRYADGHGELPAAVITEVLVEVMRRQPEAFTQPLPPLRQWLREAHLETFGGHVGFVGTPWNTALVRGLDRSAVVVGMLALGALLTWDEANTGHLRELLDRLASRDGSVGYLADEIERRTAIEGVCFTPALDWLATTARTPAERAAVALFRARAAEGAGDCVAAQRLVTAALAEQPSLKAALLDAGEYATCRGDLRAAEDYLRRAEHPVAENLRAAIRSQHVLPAATATGRNRPCPCGSGRKAKLCCATTVVPPLAARAELLYALIATFAQRAPAAERLGILIRRSTGHPQHPLLCLDLLLTNEGYLQRFLQTRGGWLREDERALLQTWAHIPIGAFEIRHVRRGESVTVRPLPQGTPIVLRDRLFSTSARRLDLFCGRVLTDAARPRMFPIPAMVSRDRRHDLLTLLAADPTADQIAAFLGPQPDPCLLNSDGHEYFDAEVTLQVPDGDAAWRRLAADLTATDTNVLDHQVDRDGKTVSLGTVTRCGQRWTLWANSRERLAALHKRVHTVTSSAREVGRRTDRIGGEPPTDGSTARTIMIDSYLLPGDPHMTEQRVQAALPRTASQSWVDTPIERLGMTPREAAATSSTAHAELDALLDDMQWRNDRNLEQDKPITMDVEWIRRELNIPPQQP